MSFLFYSAALPSLNQRSRSDPYAQRECRNRLGHRVPLGASWASVFIVTYIILWDTHLGARTAAYEFQSGYRETRSPLWWESSLDLGAHRGLRAFPRFRAALSSSQGPIPYISARTIAFARTFVAFAVPLIENETRAKVKMARRRPIACKECRQQKVG